jgi:hypothetical protein
MFYSCLGIWHVYVQGLRVLWRAYLDKFLGPLWMAILPDSKIYKKPKHTLLQIFFTWIRLAWPMIYDLLSDVINEFKGRSEKKTDKGKKGEYPGAYNSYCLNSLLDLDMLGSYSIPVVIDYAIRS